MRVYTERLRADKILVSGWIVWIVCVVSLPITPIFYGDLQSVILFVVSNLALWIGLRAFHPSPPLSICRATLVEWAYGTLRYLVPIGCIAFSIRVFDYFVLRGVPFSSNFAEVRRVLEASPPTLASAAFGLLSPAILAGGIFGVFCITNGYRTRLVLLAVALLFLYPVFSFLVGGRSTLALVVCLSSIAFVLGSPRLTRGHAFTAIAVLIMALIITLLLFVPRLLETGPDLSERIRLSGFNQLVPLNDAALSIARNSNLWASAITLYLLSLGQYVVHGVFEFFALVRYKNPTDPMLFGRYQLIIFDQISKVFHGFVAGEGVDLEAFNPRSGVYTTFWGPAFIDFKYFMPLYSWTFGVVVSYFQKRVSDGDVYALPLHCLFLFQIGSSIVANGLLWAAAIYSNVMFFVVWLALRIWRLYQEGETE